jgi:hypothetical protein
MVRLTDLLLAGGASGLDGWYLQEARSVSADGMTIVGYGYNPDGQFEGWIATLYPSTPDLNEDEWVDLFDIGLISENWLDQGHPKYLAGDANRDSIVNIFDVGVISDHWRPNPQAPPWVPEPSTAALALCAASIVFIGHDGLPSLLVRRSSPRSLRASRPRTGVRDKGAAQTRASKEGPHATLP